jgi:hypothetical protein
MAVTRQRLAAPPEQPASSAPIPVAAPADPAAEARRARDCVRLAGYMSARATQSRSAAQIAVGTGLPMTRLLEALDTLTACGYLVQTAPRRTPTGGWVPTWARHDPDRGDHDAP